MSDAQPDSQQAAGAGSSAGAQNVVLAQLRADVKEIRGQLLALEKYVRNTSFTGRIRRIVALVLGARLHELQHYRRPRPLHIPERYHTPLPLAESPHHLDLHAVVQPGRVTSRRRSRACSIRTTPRSNTRSRTVVRRMNPWR